jgi:hypothetical protein
VLLALALLPLWPVLDATVTDVRPGCAAIVQATDPRSGLGDPDGYALVLGGGDGWGAGLDVGALVALDVGGGLAGATDPRPVELLGAGGDIEATGQGYGWLDAAGARDALGARCGAG